MISASVSHDFLEKIADMEYTTDDGVKISLREEDGYPKVDLLLIILGFNYNEFGDAEYDMLSPNLPLHPSDKDTVLVRNTKGFPYEVKEMIVYNGYIRNNYPYKHIYSSGEILVGDFIYGSETKNILDIELRMANGRTFYTGAKYEGREAPLREDKSDFYGDEE